MTLKIIVDISGIELILKADRRAKDIEYQQRIMDLRQRRNRIIAERKQNEQQRLQVEQSIILNIIFIRNNKTCNNLPTNLIADKLKRYVCIIL